MCQSSRDSLINEKIVRGHDLPTGVQVPYMSTDRDLGTDRHPVQSWLGAGRGLHRADLLCKSVDGIFGIEPTESESI